MKKEYQISFKETYHLSNTSKYELFVSGDPIKIGTVIFYHDNEGVWINDISLDKKYRGNGIIAKFIESQKLKHGSMLVSIADNSVHKKYQLLGDTRYLTSDDGKKYVAKLFDWKILNKTDYRNPFPNNKIEFGKIYFPFLDWD